jgi:hypothetical protein
MKLEPSFCMSTSSNTTNTYSYVNGVASCVGRFIDFVGPRAT